MRRRTTTALLLSTMAILAGCTAGEPDPDPADSAAPSATPPPATETPAPVGGDVPDLPDLNATCEHAAPGGKTATVAVPSSWQVDGSCEFLDASLDTLPDGTEPPAAIGVRVADMPFAQVADMGTLDVTGRHAGSVAGHQMLRVVGAATGQGLYPEGTSRVVWAIELGSGTDGASSTLLLSARGTDGTGLDEAAAVVDRMARSTVVDPPLVDVDGQVVARTAGGGQPVTAVFDPADGCFRLYAGDPDGAPDDEQCDTVAPDAMTLEPVTLSAGDVTVLAGLAPARTARVDVDHDAPGAVSSSFEGGEVFAAVVDDPDVELQAVDVFGRMLATR